MSEQSAGAIMTSPVVTMLPDTPITDAAGAMEDANIGSLIVVDDGKRPEGILTRSDFVRFVADREALTSGEVPEIRSLMTTDIVSVAADDPVESVVALMKDHGIHHVPVVNEAGQVIGVVTTSDLANTAHEGFGRPD